MWQKKYEQYGSDSFTIVGLALDAEGIPPAKRYYDRFGVTFPSLVDPDYATQFGAVPKTFFVDEFGVVQNASDWEARLAGLPPVRAVPDDVRSRWTDPEARLGPAALARLNDAHLADPADLQIATQLSSRYLALELPAEASRVLRNAVSHHTPQEVAKAGGEPARLLSQAYFQMSRSAVDSHDDRVRCVTLAFYLNPTVGLGKQIARIIAPEKFDARPDGDFDNEFREGTLQRLKSEREIWLRE